MANQIIQSIKTIAQSLVDKAGYDKTRGGFIVGVNSVTNTYSVKVDGVTYPIVRAVDDATYNIGDVVKVVIPCNQATQMYISSSVLSDDSTGNKIANAVALAQDAKQLGLDNQVDISNAAKVATNFINYDSTNGLVLGNKESGSWSGYRSQILPDSFNILDESSTVLASFGPTTIIGEEANANIHLTFNNLSMVDKNGTKFFEVGDNRNADGIATLQWSSPDVPIGTSGSTTITVGNTISSIVSVSVDSVELSSSNYSFSGDEVTINNLTASSEKYIEIIYKTTDPAYYLTLGSRFPSSIIGERSVAEGRYVTASGFASHAEGAGTSAIGAFSHAEGHSTKAKAAYSHAGGYQTVADGSYMTAVGTYNTENSGKAFVVGVGDFINRRDGFTVDWDGNATVRGRLTLGKALSIANGGTGETTAAGACSNLGIKDYVIKTGSGSVVGGTYNYRMWSSGLSEYWYTIEASAGVTTKVWTSPICYNDYTTWAGLFDASRSGLFTSRPHVTISSRNSQFLAFIPYGITTAGIGTIRPISVNAKSDNAYAFSLYAVGTWK